MRPVSARGGMRPLAAHFLTVFGYAEEVLE